MGLDELNPNNIKIQYVYALINLIVFDYDKLYDELLKNAIKYGMSIKDFWCNDDYKVYFLYEEAYFEKLHEEKHIQGLYNFIAFNTVLGNAFMDKKKGNKPLDYPKENLYITSLQKEKDNKQITNKIRTNKITKANLNEALVQRLCECY